MPPAAAERTHTAPIDGAMTFDSPFPAIDGRLGLGISLLPACGQGRALLMAFQGCAFPCFADGFRAPSLPCWIFQQGFFVCGMAVRVKLPPAAYAPGFGLNRRPSGGDLSAGGACPSPMRSRWRIAAPFSAVIWPPDDGGTRRAQAREGAHGAASGARTARGREADRRDSGDARARAPRATDRAAGAGHESAPPVPRYNFRSGVRRVRRTRRGEGGSALRRARRGKGGKPPRNEQPSFAPRHGRRCGHRPSKRPEARRGRGREGARARREPASRTHGRARPAAKPPRRTAQRRPAGAGVAPPPPHAQQRHDHASGRRRGGEAGGDGAGRAALGRGNRPPPMPSAQKKRHARTRKPRARPTQSAKGKARPQIRPNCSACIRWDAGAPARSAARRRADRPLLSVAGGFLRRQALGMG